MSEINNHDKTVLSHTKAVPLPFLTRIVHARIFELDEELLQTFRKVEINFPLLNAIKQIPKYAKFLKELCTPKRKLKGVPPGHPAQANNPSKCIPQYKY
ncbi:hypothetical protein CR513_54121, partial [Mucuna pruriens]